MRTATSNGHVERFTRGRNCPVCGGSDDDPRGQGQRCHGFLTSHGGLVHCSREEHAGPKSKFDAGSQCYVHLARGPCPCGVEHAPADPPPARKRKHGAIDQVYKYHGRDGSLLFEVVRFKDPKTFLQRRPLGNGEYAWNLDGITPVLFKLPEVLRANPSEVVWIPEGEKDVRNLGERGLISTCNPMGALKWRDHYSEDLRGRHVVILPDNDPPEPEKDWPRGKGYAHAEQVARSLHGKVASVRILQLPGLPEKGGDVSDFLAAGGTVDRLRELAAITPLWEPTPGRDAPVGPPAGGVRHGEAGQARPTLANAIPDLQDGKLKHIPILMPELVEKLRGVADGWPRRIEERLFVESADHRPTYLDSSPQLFGWLDHIATIYWARGPGMISQERFYEHIRKFASRRFDSIDQFPHQPPMEGLYYMHPPVTPSPTRGLFDAFLGYFRPETDVDRELIRAAVMTVFWGGPPGSRPAFRIDGPEDDPPELGRRSVGKTKFVELVAELVGGLVDVEEREDMASVKTRILSSDEGRKRVLRLDNVKTLRLSWAALEQFLTSRVISGKALFRGEGQLPNTLTVFITMNGGSFSKDLATRVIPIRLARPVPDGEWEGKVRAFIRDNRWPLTAEILGALADEPGSITPRSRWATWEKDVLGKVAHYDRCQEAIAERASLLDDDDDQAFELEHFFRARIEAQGHNCETQTIKIPTAKAAEWYSEYTGEARDPSIASRLLRRLPLKCLIHHRMTNERFWIWKGPRARPDDPVMNLGGRPDGSPF